MATRRPEWIAPRNPLRSRPAREKAQQGRRWPAAQCTDGTTLQGPWGLKDAEIGSFDPLVNIYITIQNHHF